MADPLHNLYCNPPVQTQAPQSAYAPANRWTLRETLISLLLVAFVVTGYWTVWRMDFVYFDDPGYVSENLNVLRGLPLFTSVEGFKTSVYWAFTAFEQSNWHPLTWLSHMLDVQLYQKWTGGHHITNIILHALNTVLLFGLFWRVTGKSWRSAAVAAMFAVHPMHVESVAWVAERKDVLSTFLGLLTLHAYVNYSRRARNNGGSFLFAVSAAAIIGILGWLWYHQCFWYQEQLLWFQQLHIKPSDNIFERFQQQCNWLWQQGFRVSPTAGDWLQQQRRMWESRGLAAFPLAYDGMVLTRNGLAGFATAFVLALGGLGWYAYATGRTRFLKYCGTMFAFALVGIGIIAGLWGMRAWESSTALYWANGLGLTVLGLALAGLAVAAMQGRKSRVIQCCVFIASVAALLLVLNWILWPTPQLPAKPSWRHSPFQTMVERMWCAEFAVGLFIVFGSLAVDAVLGRRGNLGLFCVVLVLYMLGLLAKPMLVTLPFVMLLIDYWPLRRIEFSTRTSEERPAAPAVDTARTARLRARQRRRPPAAAELRRSSAASASPLWNDVLRVVFLVVEKLPLFALAGVSSVVTPLAQAHGGSMAGTNDLPIAFRLQNVMQSYAGYIGRMFWPGKMIPLHLIVQDQYGRPYVEPWMFWLSLTVFVLLTALALAALFFGRRYIAFGWFWYVGMLVPVIGFMQVGEQCMADRYTYTPYIGLFVAIVWGVSEVFDRFPQWRSTLLAVTAGVATFILASWIPWTNYQTQTWRNVETQLLHALDVEPDNWNMLNNYGVWLWKEAQKHEAERAEFLAAGKTEEAKQADAEVTKFKEAAKKSWIHGITARPTATDIHSNLGYAYSEAASQSLEAAAQLQAIAVQLAAANRAESARKLEESKKKQDESRQYMDRAEFHLLEAVKMKDISPRPHNNLGRVLLRRSQQMKDEAALLEDKARDAENRLHDAETKGKTKAAEAAKVPQLKAEAESLRTQSDEKAPPLKAAAKRNLERAIDEFEKAVRLDPSLLEARLNLGEVYTNQRKFDKATEHYKEILNFLSPSVEKDSLANFSQACFGLGRIALEQNKPDEGIAALKDAIKLREDNLPAVQRLTSELFLRGNYREGYQVLRLWLSKLPLKDRGDVAKNFGSQFGKHEPAVRAWSSAAWIFATDREPALRDPRTAAQLAAGIVELTKRQDPLALDTLAAAWASAGQFAAAIQEAQAALVLANNQGNKALAEWISRRLQSYQQSTPYISDPSGNDRP